MKWYNFINAIPGVKATIKIYGYIVDSKWSETDPDVTPQDFAAELEKYADYKEIDVYINSPGGNVFAGLAIYHMLKRQPANITVYNDGIIASIASVIAMAGDKIVMPKTSLMLIHKSLVIGIGNSDDFLTLAAELDKVDGVIAETYAARMGKDIKAVKKLMSEDRFMDAEEAKELGLVDDFGEEKDIKATIKGDILNINGEKMDISRFKNFPKDRFKAPPAAKKADIPVAAPIIDPSAPEKPDYSIAEASIEHNINLSQEVVV